MARKTGRHQRKNRIIVAAVAALASVSAIGFTTLDTTSPDAPAPAALTPAALAASPAIATSTEISPATATPVAEPSCPTGETHVAAEHIGVDGMQSCLPIGSGLAESHVDPLYGRVALEILHLAAPSDERLELREPRVACWNLNDWKEILERFRADGVNFGSSLLGWVSGTNRVINLSTHTCRRLDAIAHRGATPNSTVEASAIGTFAHETIHLGGIADEGVADCYAKQLARHAGELLGATNETARVVADLSAEYAHQERAGTEYDDPNCFDGGSLDIDTDDAVWVG